MRKVAEKFPWFIGTVLSFVSSLAFASGACDGPMQTVKGDRELKSRLTSLASQLRLQRSPLEGLGTDLAAISTSLKDFGFEQVSRSFTQQRDDVTILEILYYSKQKPRGIDTVRFRVTAEGLAPEQIYVRKVEVESFAS